MHTRIDSRMLTLPSYSKGLRFAKEKFVGPEDGIVSWNLYENMI